MNNNVHREKQEGSLTMRLGLGLRKPFGGQEECYACDKSDLAGIQAVCPVRLWLKFVVQDCVHPKGAELVDFALLWF